MRKLVVALASGLPLAFAVFLTGCNSMSQMPVVDPTPIINRRTNLAPRKLKLKLTLDDSADLKVKAGNSVRKEQVISDLFLERPCFLGRNNLTHNQRNKPSIITSMEGLEPPTLRTGT
jgi:hypothetical protein